MCLSAFFFLLFHYHFPKRSKGFTPVLLAGGGWLSPLWISLSRVTETQRVGVVGDGSFQLGKRIPEHPSPSYNTDRKVFFFHCNVWHRFEKARYIVAGSLAPFLRSLAGEAELVWHWLAANGHSGSTMRDTPTTFCLGFPGPKRDIPVPFQVKDQQLRILLNACGRAGFNSTFPGQTRKQVPMSGNGSQVDEAVT